MTNTYTENYLELDEVMADGYGIVSRKVMRADFISTKAKALYSYLCSFAGSGDTAFPSTDTMRHELQLAKDTFYSARKELQAFGIIEVNTFRTRNGAKTIYKLVSNAHITDDASALVEEKQQAKANKINNLPNSNDPRKAASTNSDSNASAKTRSNDEEPKAVIIDTPEGFDRLEKKSLKKIRSDELAETIEAYNDAVQRGYTPKEIDDAYALYVERYRQEHPDTIRFAKRLKNYLTDSNGLLFDAGKPLSRRNAVIKKSPEVIANSEKAKAEEQARIALETTDPEYQQLSMELIDLARDALKYDSATPEYEQTKSRMDEICRINQQKVDAYIEEQSRA